MEDDAVDQCETNSMKDFSRTTLIKEEEEVGEKAAPVTSGGLINQLISTIIPAEKDATECSDLTEQKKEVEEEQGKEEGGILENFISNLTSPRASNPVDVEFLEGSEDPQQNEGLQEPGDGGGGSSDSIVSHLPTSIPENAALTSDEASMLIHAVVHD